MDYFIPYYSTHYLKNWQEAWPHSNFHLVIFFIVVASTLQALFQVWSASTGRCLRTLVGHTGGVWSSQMEGNVIVSGSTDRTLKVWNADTGACDHTLYGHTSTVRCMHLHKNL